MGFSLKRLFARKAAAQAPLHAPIAPGTSREMLRAQGRPQGLAELSAELLSLAWSFRLARDLGDATDVRKKSFTLLERFENEGRSFGHSTTQIDQAKFALVALLDESILSSGWPGKDQWRMNPLQREIYKMNVAGEEFYTRLELLRQNKVENRSVIEVFYAALVMGFEGRFKLLGRDKLEALIRELSQDLSEGRRTTAESLSPHWQRPDDFPEVVGEGIPVWMTLVLFLPAALLEMLLFATAAGFSSGRTAKSIEDLMNRLAQ